MKKRLNKIDWDVIAVLENPNDKNNPENEIEFHTSFDFCKYGFGEIVVVGKVKEAEKIMNLINTFGRMLIEGERFATNTIHCIDNTKGVTEFKFIVVKYKANNKKYIQLVMVE